MPLLLARPDETKATAQVGDAPTIEIGLLNNLSDAGLQGGERQFADLLGIAAGAHNVRLSFFSLPAIPRGAEARAHMDAHYADFVQLMRGRLDGLIVTGCEPRADDLPQEAFWPELAEVIDWAEHNTRSTIWSCLAAHAAVLHLDGIERRRLPAKRAGLFRVTRVAAHPLLDGASEDLRVPHSRWNGLEPDELTAAGYQILTLGDIVGADTFVKQWRSLFVYLQGHPEYDAGALGREYRRDVGRFLDGTCDDYPNLPAGYFDTSTEAALMIFAARARKARDPKLAAALPIRRDAPSAWPRGFATTLFRNWLDLIAAKASGHAV